MSHDESKIENPERYPGDFVATAQVVAIKIKKAIRKRKKSKKVTGLIGFGAPAQINKPISDGERYENIRSAELNLKLQIDWLKSQQPSSAQIFSIRQAWFGGKIEEAEEKLRLLDWERKQLERLGIEIKNPIREFDIYATKLALAKMEESYQLAKRAEAEKQKQLEADRSRFRIRPSVTATNENLYSIGRNRAPRVVQITNDDPGAEDHDQVQEAPR